MILYQLNVFYSFKEYTLLTEYILQFQRRLDHMLDLIKALFEFGHMNQLLRCFTTLYQLVILCSDD
jgi:hypothetical protein